MLATRELEYDLPPGRIATRPAFPRDSARLMVVAGTERVHALVRDLPEFLRPGDVIVVNETRVLPARLVGTRAGADGALRAFQGLYLGEGDPPGCWRVLLRGRYRPGERLTLGEGDRRVALEVVRASGPGEWSVRPDAPGSARSILDRVGRTPLPPYVLGARRDAEEDANDERDRADYQTVFAGEDAGSVAAPTAGLHLTESVLARLEAIGVERVSVTLDVGVGTFRPVEAEFVEDHPIHEERASMARSAAERVLAARARGSMVLAIGTTSVRVLETYARALGGGPARRAGSESGGPVLRAGSEMPHSINTRLLITPGFAWRWTDAILTNFHLPRSTLMALVAARMEGGAPALLRHYQAAIDAGYRFYSFGDAMLVLPRPNVFERGRAFR